MEYHTLNICVKTASPKDYYTEVAINRFPIVVIGDREELEEILSSDQIREWVSHNIRNQDVYKTAKFCIRHFQEDGTMESEEIEVPDKIKLDLTSN